MYDNLTVDVDEDKEVINVTVTVKNNSKISGEEVVQVYFRDEYSSATRPVKELASYRRISLSAGESREVSFEMPIEQLAFYDIQMNRCVEPGTFIWMVGGSSSDDNCISEKVVINDRFDYD